MQSALTKHFLNFVLLHENYIGFSCVPGRHKYYGAKEGFHFHGFIAFSSAKFI